ncbi:hypothetical protein ACR6HW_10140 [Fusibacter sp. JL298sf-3]
MVRKSLGLLLVVLIILTFPVAWGSTITSDEIIVAEPIKSKLSNDKSQFLIVNVTNAAIDEAPIDFSLVKVEEKLPFAKEIEEGLNVSVMSLTKRSTHVDGLTPKRTFAAASGYSDRYQEETKLINRFFELKDKLTKVNKNIKVYGEGQTFSRYLNAEEAKMDLSLEAFVLYEKWSAAQQSRKAILSELSGVQSKYMQLFEREVLSGEISSPSYFEEIGKLDNGQYSLRFFDGSSKLVKETQFDVIEMEASAAPVLPVSITK